MTDTPTNLTLNCAPAHYPAGVATPKRRRNAELTPAQSQSITRVRAAAQKLADAEREAADARTNRIEVLRAEWATLSPLGATRIAREVGEDLIGEGTVRGYTADLRAQERAAD